MVSFEDRVANFHRIIDRLQLETQIDSDERFDQIRELDGELQKELINIQFQELPVKQLVDRIEFLLEVITGICNTENRSVEEYADVIIRDVRRLQKAAIRKQK